MDDHGNVEEEYLDVLQNIEFAIVSVYRNEQAFSDYDVGKILNVLISGYQTELSKRDFPSRIYRHCRNSCI
jgi:hypothetical protein